MTTRILTGAALVLLLLFAIYFSGWVFAILWIASVCLALYEMHRALKNAGHHILVWPTWAALLIAIPGFLLLTELGSMLLLVLLVALTMFLVSALMMFRKDSTLEDLCMSVLPLFSIVIPAMSLLGLTRIETIGLQRVFISMAFFVPVMGDSAAFFIGSKYGKTKLLEAVSPKKTVEGALAGLLGSMLAAIIIYLIGMYFRLEMPLFLHFILLGFLGGIAGQIGDLFASFVKRHCKIKDYGHIFPGHGGMMDRLDSVLFCGALVYLYQALLWV